MWGCGEVWLLMFLEFAWNAWEKRNLGELYKKTVEKNDGTFSQNQIISVASMSWNSNARPTTEGYLSTYNVLRTGNIAFEGNKSKNLSSIC